MTAQDEHFFVQSVKSALPVQEAGRAIQTFYEGDGAVSDPVIESNEERIGRGMEAIRYVFFLESEDPAEIDGMAPVLEEVVNSMQFVQ